jgi:predicted transcriptional regulator
MPEKPRRQPTAAELEILEALWALGPATVRQARDELDRRSGKSPGYTTVLKLLQIMTDKGLVLRDASRRTHVYRPAESPEATRGTLVGDLIERAFAGSTSGLVLSALSSRPATAEELETIRRFLDDQDGPGGGDR